MSARNSTFSVATMALLAAAAATGCDKGSTAPTTPAGAAAPAPPQGEAPMEAAGGEAGKQYRVVVEPVALKAGEKKAVVLRIEPGKGLKFNDEFPTKFKVAAQPFARSERETLTLKDGDIKVENKVGVVTVPVVATAAGRGNLALTGRFSVCSDEQCYVLSETLQVAVTVQ